MLFILALAYFSRQLALSFYSARHGSSRSSGKTACVSAKKVQPLSNHQAFSSPATPRRVKASLNGNNYENAVFKSKTCVPFMVLKSQDLALSGPCASPKLRRGAGRRSKTTPRGTKAPLDAYFANTARIKDPSFCFKKSFYQSGSFWFLGALGGAMSLVRALKALSARSDCREEGGSCRRSD